ncbi:hypothetical protein [Nocardia sp. CA-290969]|uniref:hypothetical protein n=1 Tax=Nocardia sp. CA-290969 TaxID=3239986 RepID=UPI003D92A5BF
MTEHNPVKIEEAIRGVANQIANSVTACGDAYIAFLKADHEYDVAYAHAYLNAPGPAHGKRYDAELATINERRARDVADATYKHADRRAKALDAELRAWQSVGASVRSMYGAAGRGES